VYDGEPESGEVRVYHTPAGDGVGIYFHQVRPDLPVRARSEDTLIAFYARLLKKTGGRLVEVRTVVVANCPAVRTVVSMQQPPSRRTYVVGSLTVPFRDFSFVVKCQCAEAGSWTGAKEAILFSRRLQVANPAELENPELISDFNPDDPSYDTEFPDHPVARARRVLDHIADSLTITQEVRELPGFALPHSSIQ
jgi:hypothetical protein